MSKLSGLPLSEHLDSLFSILKCDTIYGYPTRKIYHGYKGYDFSVNLFGKKAATPMGPAAGPHTQLAQNIVLSYLAGSRIIELKTIQILDQLEIPRPCIDARNIGFNIEWSQELSLDASFQEYLNAWILLHLLKEKQLLGEPAEHPFYDFIFDVSIGYDVKGIQSDQVQSWLNKISNAEESITNAIASLPEKYSFLKSATIPPKISDSVTLSTFHGCPPNEIEKIVQHLIKENKFNVVIKLNPTLLGYDYVYDLLINKLGYKNIELDKTVFDNDLSFDKAIEIVSGLSQFAKIHNRSVGVKFTNTLVVKNNERIFNEPIRYLSGAPLYVIAMHTMNQFREKIGWDLPVSFSGGINQSNFADTLACNMVPVTSCTDILKKGGYNRFSNYLVSLKTAMDSIQAKTIEQFILNRTGSNDHGSQQKAGRINTTNIIKHIDEDPQYYWKTNSHLPKTIPSKLKLFDCINCNICIPVCPNAANFNFTSDKQTEHYTDYKYENGSFRQLNMQMYSLTKEQQIGNIAEFCNDCGNCETYCPESGAPFKEKPRFFINLDNFESNNFQDGFYFASSNVLYAQINRIKTKLKYDPDKKIYIWNMDHVIIQFDEKNQLITGEVKGDIKERMMVDTTPYIIMKFVLKSFINYRQSFPRYLDRTDLVKLNESVK